MRRIKRLLLLGSLAFTTAISGASAQPAHAPDAWTSFCVGGGLKSTDGIIQLVNFVFRDGPAPQPVLAVGDVNCQEGVSASDIIYLINYVLRSGAPPCPYCGFVYTDTSLATEAELMALWYSDSLVAPPLLRERMQSDLRRIRAELGPRHAGVTGSYFYAPWPASHIRLYVDSAAGESIAAGTYHAWDSLNVLCELDSFEINGYNPFGGYGVDMQFAGLKNSTVLAAAYRPLPGVQYCSASHRIGGWPTVYPLFRGDTSTYVFEYAWGDCPAGCIDHIFWYAKATIDSVWFVGEWSHHAPEPPWWPEALQNLQRYW